jgi:hypothetical protein
MSSSSNATCAGIGLGAAIAVAISWSINHSIWWAILHGFLGWLYVIYYGIFLPRVG